MGQRLVPVALALALSGCTTLGGIVPLAPRASALETLVDSIVSSPPLDRTHWGIEVYDPEAGEIVYSLNPERHFVPASNTKLVVTATALETLGEDYRYTTELYALRPSARDTAARGLIVVARGDPTLSARFHGTELAAIEQLADSIQAAGVRRVRGEIVVDASRFDRALVHPTWEVGDLPWYYAAPVAAFAVGEATVQVAVWPGLAPGSPAAVRPLGPPQALSVVSRIVTDTLAEADIEAEFVPGLDAPALTGSIPFAGAADTVTLSVVDPAAYAGRVLAAALEARTIEVEGGVRVVQDTAEAARLRDPLNPLVERIATWTSPPMSEVVAAILKPSNNWIAEQVLKTLGAEATGVGSWRTGLDVERAFLFDRVGLDSAAVFLRDASGLSAQNLLTPRAIVRLLTYGAARPWGATYRAAMAEAGVTGTTLARRLQALEGRVFAKTGTITHVNALSGYVRTEAGRELVFSILTNASGVPASQVRAAIDRIVEAIAREE